MKIIVDFRGLRSHGFKK